VKRVLVIGDIIADVYRECVFKKMCPDAPSVRAVVEIGRNVRPGGAANVALNLAALAPKIQVDLIGVLDAPLARLIKFLSGSRVDVERCIFDEPLCKERVIMGGETLLRVDGSDYYDFQSKAVRRSLEEYLAGSDPELIVMSDYGSGTVGASLPLLMEHRSKLLVDTKMTDLTSFASGGVRTLLAKLNRMEWEAALERHHSPEDFFSFLVVTDGPGGVRVTTRRETEQPGTFVCHTVRMRAHVVDEIDVCGCGDTFLAGLAAMMVEGRDIYTATQFANAAAATVVTKPRTAIADLGATIGLLGWNL